ncbi:sulfatase family protein [Pelagicoccus mobilis]|uniref:Arylsulfatase n=1 Tax=Pelagicoccus mobilis TaxID=415221 RepID=A0A934VSH9_9BACT|nr:arylsulfatase [Pelagicoccus mobilis]MBK1879035.1 arylsulfatase [Pelagicoccus mobilis]
MKIKQLGILLGMFGCVAAFAAEPFSLESSAETSRPNIIFILADDLGYGCLNSYGADEKHVRTPNIDRLAAEGKRFTDANTPSSVCSPTRYALLTGRYDWRTDLKSGVLNTLDPLHIDPSRPTIASIMKRAGYRTAAIGKWHLGYGSGSKLDFTKELSPGPLDLGFDYHFAVPQNHGDSSGVYVRNTKVVGLRSDQKIEIEDSSYGRKYYGIDAPQRVDEEVMDVLTDDAVTWLEEQDSKSPFFLYFAPVAVHFPFTPSDKTKGSSSAGYYGDWIHELDLSVGRILDTIDRMGVAEDTLVVFTSDNGGVLMTEGDRPEAQAYQAGLLCNGDWRGRKHSIYEGGFRVPFMVRWPGRVDAGAASDATFSLVDMFATLAEVVDQPIPAGDVAEDSLNVLPYWLEEESAVPIRDSMALHSPNGNFALRMGPWKYIEGKPNPNAKRVIRKEELHSQLYNLESDPGETRNLFHENPEVASRMAKRLDALRESGRSR